MVDKDDIIAKNAFDHILDYGLKRSVLVCKR